MRKRITVFVVLMMVLCLALTGCGQNTNRTDEGIGNKVEDGVGAGDDTGRSESPGEDFVTGDSVIMDGSNNPNGTTPDSNLSKVDNKNPQQDSNGMYIYNVQGHEIKLSVNIMDYIGWINLNGVRYENYFNVDWLAEDFGYDEVYLPNEAYMKHRDDVDGLVFAGFRYNSDFKTTEIIGGYDSMDTGYLEHGDVFIEPYDTSYMEYIYGGGYPISLDMMILCAYNFEFYSTHTSEYAWIDIFGEKVPRIPAY